MTDSTPARVDAWFDRVLLTDDPVLDAALRRAQDAHLPSLQVTASQGKFLQLLSRMHNSRRILEIGTLGGFSTIWLARSLPDDGKLVTLELDPRHAAVARTNIDAAGFEDMVELRQGRAADSMRAMIESGEKPFDFIFIDADKPSISEYLQLSLQLSQSGTVILIDNVVRNGSVIDSESADPNIIGVQRVVRDLVGDTRVSGTAIQTVGAKGYDGFILLIVNG